MQADVHFEKGVRFEHSQAKLFPEEDWELAIEGCYYAAFQIVLAGCQWRGVRHSDNHSHAEARNLLTQASAPSEVSAAWNELEAVRAGRVYGKQPDSGECERSRIRVQVIKSWALAAQPAQPPQASQP
jgi:hypothetical protein